MSSIQSQFAQIPNSVRLLYIVEGGNAFAKSTLLTYLAANKSLIYGFDGTVLNARDGNSLITNIISAESPTIPVTPGNIYRDMGRKLYVQTNGVTVCIFTYCQLVQGPNTEGVPANYSTKGNVYVCTWSSDTESAQTPLVARSG